MRLDERMRLNPVRWCGLEPINVTLELIGFSAQEREAAITPEPGIHGEEEWPGFSVVLLRCRERALVARYDRRFAGQPPEEWEAIERLQVTPAERAAKERSLAARRLDAAAAQAEALADEVEARHPKEEGGG